MRWIWIDRFEEFESGRSARAVKCVSLAEDHLHDHLPGFPVMPNPLILEGLAQTGGILLGEVQQFRKVVVLAKVPKAVFHAWARPGDKLDDRVQLLDIQAEGGIVAGTA
ncbi:MAG: beta-hydroxyacyl-ACP dehydratase, partial [Planctomycetaceae bacterium]